ncbi:802_t:CDS:10 [Dentiscutata erythropus]|uniref:802_t:CDS:1 n=1 Tax=Dentiscutata erythropus TaxID=1348616 RepID=A0A9N9G6F0_9GLOM|nr:802_t:CDS:10 [Dentiscutata erythropus]
MSTKQFSQRAHESDVLDGFILVRPVWVDDETVKVCKGCETSFTPLRRKHHCRQCGNIFCQECTSKNIALPQLGYLKPERVCSGCFEIAYLVGYVISNDKSTQTHGARGLLDIVERGNEQEIFYLITNGGLDALVYLCRATQSCDLHLLGTTALASLAGNESFKSYIIAKGSLPHLYHLILLYYNKTESETLDLSDTLKFLDSVSNIILNIANILYYLSISGSLCQQMLTDDIALDAILKLADFQLGTLYDDDSSEDDSLPSYEEIRLRIELIRSLASKTISCLSTYHGLDRLMRLLHSNIYEVRKYAAKSIAYLSLRNDGRAELLTSVINLEDEQLLKDNQVAISHACCAMANLATNAESQQLLIHQPLLLSNLCRMVGYFLTDREIQRHVARLLANFALYEENKARMLSYQIIAIEDHETSQTEESWEGVIQALIAIGDSPVSDVEIQRHIIRALDNLSTEVPSVSLSKLTPCIPLINRILDTVKDDDIKKRASHVLNKIGPSFNDLDEFINSQNSDRTTSTDISVDIPSNNLIIFDDNENSQSVPNEEQNSSSV